MCFLASACERRTGVTNVAKSRDETRSSPRDDAAYPRTAATARRVFELRGPGPAGMKKQKLSLEN